MEEHKPYVPDITPYKDITLKAVIMGAIFGVIFGSANAYLGLRVGLTISTAIPLAVISVAVFKALSPILGKSTILDCNIAQTTGSASSSLASGLIFTIPALFLWGFNPSLFKIGTLALLGGILGVLFMIPLRRALIVKEHATLPYPEGTAAAQVLISADEGGAKAKNVFLGLAVGAFFKALVEIFKLWPEKIYLKVPVLKKALLGMEPTPALLGVGFILGPRIAGIMVAGGLLSWIGIIPLISYFGENLSMPLFPETNLPIAQMSAEEIWKNYIKFIGAGAVAVGGIIAVVKAMPTMFSALKVGIKDFSLSRQNAQFQKKRTDNDLPITVLGFGVLIVIIIIILAPQILGISTTFLVRLIASVCIVIFAFCFVTVSSRIVGMIGVSSNPTSGMTIVTLLGTSLLFLALGWTDILGMATALTVGTVVCVAASIAGDISQDLKAGYIIGATPKRQQSAELIGVLASAFAIAGAIWLLGEAFSFGSTALPAPQATLMKTVVEGVLGGNLPWGLVLIGGAFAIVAELLGVPSLPFAVGIYLPLSTMTPVFVGGAVRHFIEKRAGNNEKLKATRKEKGVLLSSGFIAGEGILMVFVAIYAYFAKATPKGIGLVWPGNVGDFVALAAFIALVTYLVVKSYKK
ncbi:MAG TPA: oligopeptide transporter, OPT family [Candidatus Aminicenantes bacterium]|nr:oligopeptide transporter, OPT family [Candidatus Aminicenantes bacterium]HEB36392.1 oligopeptide transporter, OPT family [Candidatus Aminicenantes bacterium]